MSRLASWLRVGCDSEEMRECAGMNVKMDRGQCTGMGTFEVSVLFLSRPGDRAAKLGK